MTTSRRVTLVGLVAGGRGGVPRYAAALARGVDDVLHEFPDLDITFFTTRAGADAVGRRSALRIRTLPVDAPLLNRGPGRIAADQLVGATVGGDLLHFFDTTGPVLRPGRPFTATIHDVSLLHGYGRAFQQHKHFLIPWSMHHARKMLAISAFARDEAVELVGVAPERITVVHSGPGFAEAPSAGSRRRQTPTRPYALFVGNLTASKNLPFLIRAFGAASAPELLVLAGRPLERYDEIEAEIATSPRRDQILVLHDVDDAELASLYTHAVLLALPSKYEGFGLTALEAMQHGCPVLVSDIPALREISGAGALVLPVGDAESWTGALERVATDPTFRDSLRVRGTQTVAGYSWQSTARGLCEMFRDVPLSSAR